MSDRRPEKLWVETDQKINESVDGYHAGYRHRPATPADLLAVVRRGVESGTIKGEEVEARIVKGVGLVVDWKAPGPGRFIVVGPV